MTQFNRKNVAKTKDEMLDELQAVRDLAKVRLQLFSMEARERWEKFATQLDGWEKDLKDQGEAVAENAAHRFGEFTHAAREFLKSDSSEQSASKR